MANPQLVVDTDVIIDYLRQRTDTLKAALLSYECAMTVISLYELKAVTSLSSRQERLVEQLESVMIVLAFDSLSATSAASMWRILNSQGLPIGLRIP